MKRLQQLMLGMAALVTFSACASPIKNATTEKFKVAGNCGMCEETIETAAFKKGVSEAEWNETTKEVTVTYDKQKTSTDEVLKRIAYAGYDNEKFLAPDDVYSKLPQCCQYDRMKKVPEVKETVAETHDHHEAVQEPETPKNPLAEVYAAYFKVKDALVKDDKAGASNQAAALAKAINGVAMDKMTSDQHIVWMKVQKDLVTDAEHIAETKDIEHQREHFTKLSKNMHDLMKVVKADETVYYQHCPMYNDGKGADWLSKESTIKNPYYGSSMLNCGKVTETIK